MELNLTPIYGGYDDDDDDIALYRSAAGFYLSNSTLVTYAFGIRIAWDTSYKVKSFVAVVLSCLFFDTLTKSSHYLLKLSEGLFFSFVVHDLFFEYTQGMQIKCITLTFRNNLCRKHTTASFISNNDC